MQLRIVASDRLCLRTPSIQDIDRSAIEWVRADLESVQGCIKSVGCKNCYMYRDKKRVTAKSRRSSFGQRRRRSTGRCAGNVRSKAGVRQGLDRYVFTCSWSDWFIKEADGWRDEAWSIIRQCPGLIFLILTKRVDRITDHLPAFWNEIKDRCVSA